MATYNITKSDGSSGPAIADAASPDTQTDLQLVGQNAVSFGLDVAQSFYFLLENFAKDTSPGVGGVIGQLWYDKGGISTTPALNVWSGSVWKPLASTAVGTAANSMSRWDNTLKKWTEETQLTLTTDGVLSILDSGLTDSVSFSHDGTDFNIAGTLTADINVTGVTAVNMPSLTLVTALAEIEGGTGTDTYTTGDILYSDTADSLVKLAVGTNGDVLTLAAGVPSWVAGSAGVSALNDLSDVTLTAPANNSILYRAAGIYIDSDISALSFDGSILNATRFGSGGGILSADLIDRSAPGTLTATTFSGNITAQADILLGDSDEIIFGTGSDVAMDFDTTDFTITAATAVDFVISGFSGSVTSDAPIRVTDATGAQLRAIGTSANTTTNEAFVSAYNLNEAQEQIRMGTVASSDFTEVRSLVQDLNLYASNSLVFNLNSTETIATQGGTTTMTLHAVSGANTSSTVGVYDDGGVERNVGYNETPESVVSGARTIDIDDIGKFLTRSGITSRAITIDNDTDIPVGGSTLVHNGNGSGTLTILEGTITSLEWIDGRGSAPSTGTRTIAYNSIVTLRKKSSTVWQIWGNGIT